MTSCAPRVVPAVPIGWAVAGSAWDASSLSDERNPSDRRQLQCGTNPIVVRSKLGRPGASDHRADETVRNNNPLNSPTGPFHSRRPRTSTPRENQAPSTSLTRTTDARHGVAGFFHLEGRLRMCLGSPSAMEEQPDFERDRRRRELLTYSARGRAPSGPTPRGAIVWKRRTARKRRTFTAVTEIPSPEATSAWVSPSR